MTEFEYVWLHIPSGREGIRQISTLERIRFLELLNKWNTQHPGVWQYWEA